MDRKTKYYLGLYLFLRHVNLLSPSLDMDFRKNLKEGLKLRDEEFEDLLASVDKVLNYDVCDLWLHFDDE